MVTPATIQASEVTVALVEIPLSFETEAPVSNSNAATTALPELSPLDPTKAV